MKDRGAGANAVKVGQPPLTPLEDSLQGEGSGVPSSVTQRWRRGEDTAGARSGPRIWNAHPG